MGIATRLGAKREALVAAALGCARAASDYGAGDDPAGRAALEAAESFARGDGTEEACGEAARRAEAASDAARDGAAAVRAALDPDALVDLAPTT